MGEGIFKRKNKKGLLEFTMQVFSDLKTFVVRCPPRYAVTVDKSKYALLIGELLRTYSRAAGWKTKKTEGEFKTKFTLGECLSAYEWEKIFALATSRKTEAVSYLDLTNVDRDAASTKTHKAKRGEKRESIAQAKQKAVGSMPVSEALRTISADFDDTLCDLNADSCAWLSGLLERARPLDVWEQNTSAAMDAHADLLRALGQSFRHQRKSNKKGVQIFTDTLLHGDMGSYVVQIGLHPGLDKTKHHLLVGELLRTHELGLSSDERKKNWTATRFRMNFVFSSGGIGPVLKPDEWESILQQATSRLDESLSYRDLVTPTQPVKPKMRRHSALVLQSPQAQKEERASAAPRPKARSASMSYTAPANPTTDSETGTNAKNTDKEAEEVNEELGNDDVTGNRYDKEKCTVS